MSSKDDIFSRLANQGQGNQGGDIFSRLAQQQTPQQQNQVQQPQQQENPESLLRQIERGATQLPLGALEASPVGVGASLFQLAGTGESLAELEELEERLPELREKFPNFGLPEKIDREKYLKAVEQASETFPTISNIGKFVEEKTGVPLQPKSETDEFLRFIGNLSGFAKGSAVTKLSKGLKGATMLSALQTAGIPKPIAQGLALYTSLHEKTPKGFQLPKEKVVPKEEIPIPGAKAKAEAEAPKQIKVKETLPSGLTKPRALEAKRPSLGIITKEKQQQAIKKLEDEASKLTKESLHKHVPEAKRLEEGFDFETHFKNEFGPLKQAINKANPRIEIKPVTRFLQDNFKKYHGLTSPHEDAKKIISETVKFMRSPKTQGKDLYSIIRSNNKKIKDIYETARFTGKHEEYVNFLLDMNRAITDSFKQTLPKDSKWMKRFLELNEGYGQYKNALKTNYLLKPLLQGNPTPSNLKKFINDPRLQKKLELAMGKQGASEVVQIAKDLEKASDAIKSIKAQDIKVMDAAFPIALIIPFVKIPASIYGIKKAADWARRGYGWYLTTPATRTAYDSAVKAIADKNPQAYVKATNELKKEMKAVGIDERKLLEFKPTKKD